MRKAVIDVGSNSVLLVVGELAEGRLHTVFEAASVTGLGEGTKSTGVLSERGMERTLAALSQFDLDARAHGANEVKPWATMAARMASNSPEFLRRTEAQGTPVQLLSGEDEAELGFLAVAEDPLFESSNRISIIDPGGNSTELVTAECSTEGWRTLFCKSFPIGTLGLRDGPLKEESPTSKEILEAFLAIDSILGLEYLPQAVGLAVVLGATGTNLITIKKRLADWEPELVHGESLNYDDVSQAFGRLCRMSDAERSAIVGLEKGREKTIHIGALILERFMFAIHAEQVTVSVRGWRHALLEKLLRKEVDS